MDQDYGCEGGGGGEGGRGNKICLCGFHTGRMPLWGGDNTTYLHVDSSRKRKPHVWAFTYLTEGEEQAEKEEKQKEKCKWKIKDSGLPIFWTS